MLVFAEHWDWGTGFTIGSLWPGSLGVEIFFVLSGFLIANMINRNVWQFYLKRILRIWPVYFIYLIVLILVTGGDVRDFILPLTFTSNLEFIAGMPTPLNTGHFWTLAIEEQFYLLSPLLLLIRKTWILPVLFFAIIGFFIFEFFWFQYPADLQVTLGRALPITGFFGILNGILIKHNFYRIRYGQYISILLMGIYFFLFLVFPEKKALYLPVFSIGFSFLFQYLLASKTLLHKVLEFPLIAGLGVVSYSFYVVHYCIIIYCIKYDFTNHSWIAFPVAVLVSIASYFLIERPFLFLKKYIVKPIPR